MKKVILASKSPQRLELLNMLGFNVETFSPDLDESSVTSDSPMHLAEKLSELKAENVYQFIQNKKYPVIAADTLVESNGTILGKPHSNEEAFEMLHSLSGKIHFVHTGITVIFGDKKSSAVETAKVKFRKLSDNEINSYILTGDPLDKAGAYGIQGRAGAFVERIEGDFYAIVGLPLCRLTMLLKATGTI